MRTKTITRTLISVALAVTFLAAVVPTAEAQAVSSTLTITMSTPSEAVKPLQAPLTFNGKVDYVSDGTASKSPIGVPVQLTVTRAPSWATVLVSPANGVITQTTPGQQYSGSLPFTVIVTASDQAPAFQADQIEISATTLVQNPDRPATGKQSVPVVADYFSIIDVQLAETIKVDRPQTPVTFPLKVTNFGNANTKVSFEVLEKTQSLTVPIPNPITLQSKQAGGNLITADVPLTVQTPYKNGYMNEVGVVNYKITSTYALDPKIKGDESTVSVIVTTKGFYVPGPEPFLVVGMIGALAMALRRRV